uniref:EF-hand domain-containing protein n=1 Tax=Mola mola TaxID=94237 RepID=A0A3Q4BUT6_MOLML
MAAFTAEQATTNNMSSTAGARTSWHGRGNSGESGDVKLDTVLEETRDFFQICDIENKGFITRRDMQRLNGGLPFSAEELENVFDTLDSDGNGYLTLDEFSSGFSEFLCGQKKSAEKDMEERAVSESPAEVLYQTQWEEGPVREDEGEEEKHFSMLMERLGANSVFEDPAEVRSLWARLRRDEPHLLSNFEDFLARVTFQIIDANQEKQEMESALKRKAATHDDEIQHLYEEMEQQIKKEKDRIALQDYERFLSRSQGMELQLSNKQMELEQLFQKQGRLEQQYQELHSEQNVTKVENVKLKQTNDELARELDLTSQELLLAQEQLSVLQEQSTRLHEEKEMEIYRLTEGLQRERASLLKQLDLLREMNKHLRDEKDICFQVCPIFKIREIAGIKAQNCQLRFNPEEEEEQTTSSVRQNLANTLSQSTWTAERRGHLQRIISIEEDPLPHLLQGHCPAQSALQECSEKEEASDSEENIDLVMSYIYPPAQQQKPNAAVEQREAPTSLRGQPVGKETKAGAPPPDRLFKIVLVGNSSVGKTSLLKRFCDDSFQPGTSATVGIDYSVKTITVDNSQVALQLWDTAGQERYRSITKQFFRKADGVVVMYDITAEQSFTAVRQWLTSIKESAGEDPIPIMLLGNKTDKALERQVLQEVGERLSKDCQMTFFECSACSGHNVVESMVHLASLYKEKEKTVQLVRSPTEKKRSCC